MSCRIRVIVNDDIVLEGELNHSNTANMITSNLPLSGVGETWGEEIYFPISLQIEPENPVEVVEEGDLAYWPPMQAFCIFYGPTPVSRGNEIRAAGPVNILGKITDDNSRLKQLQGPVNVKVEKVE